MSAAPVTQATILYKYVGWSGRCCPCFMSPVSQFCVCFLPTSGADFEGAISVLEQSAKVGACDHECDGGYECSFMCLCQRFAFVGVCALCQNLCTCLCLSGVRASHV